MSLFLPLAEPGARLNGGATPLRVSPHERLHRLSKKPLSFWFLNQWLEEEELTRQIGELKAKGFGGFFLHPRGGLEVPYGSRLWYEKLAHCIREARRLGLEAWLYDEDPYPSGAAGGLVTLENPHLRAMELRPVLMEVTEAGEAVFDLPPGALHGAWLVDAHGCHPIGGDAGLVRTQWRQKMRSNSYYSPYEHEGTPHWRAETHSPHFRIVTPVLHPPALLLALIKVPVTQNPWGDFPDLLNPEAVAAFIRSTHERYFEHFSGEIGPLLPGIFTDESKLRGAIPWSPVLDRLMLETGGVTLAEVLPHLVLELSEETLWFRWVFREALARGFLESFAEPIREACQERGLLWTGHFSPEEDPVAQALCVPGLFRLLTRMDIPGTDLIGVNLGDERCPLLHLSPKIASSAAHLSGKPYVACEALAVTDWVQDFDFITRAVHWLFSLGVNRIVIHGQYYSIDGPRKREAPPSQFYQGAGWEQMPPLLAGIERLSEALSRGRHRAPILLYYPEETFMVHAVACQETNGRSAAIALEEREKLGALSHQLLTRGYDFDLIDAEHLLKVAVKGGAYHIGEESYELLLVPGKVLTEATWNQLEAFRAKGGALWLLEQEVTILSRPPRRVRHPEAVGDDLFLRLEAVVAPLWRCDHPLTGHLRETPEGPLLFLCNNARERFCGKVELSFAGPYEICSPNLGVWQLAGEALEFGPGQGMLIRQARQTAPRALASDQWIALPAQWSDWEANPVGENALLLSEVAMVTSRSRSTSGPLPLEAFYGATVVDLASPSSLAMPLEAGERHFMSAFEWSGPIAPLRLVGDHDLLPDGGVARFYFNGALLPPLEKKRTFDPMNRECALEGLLREGRNTLIWVQEAKEGTPLPYDGVRLFGEFHAEHPYSRSTLVHLRRRPASYRCSEPLPPQLLGHGHFPGIMEYRATVTLPALPPRIALRFASVFESMEVVINGKSADYLWSEPYLLEIDTAMLQEGENELLLRCATSPANYLLGLQRPAGALGPIEWCVPIG